jgi:hypothetical protein
MSKTNTTYAIDTGDGHQLCAGLPGHLADSVARQRADQRGESVYLYAEGQDEDDVQSVEIKPSAHRGCQCGEWSGERRTLEAVVKMLLGNVK